MIKNEFVNIVKVSRRTRLNQISKMNCDNCFQISEINMIIKFSKKNKLKQTFVTISMISTIKLTNMKIKLFNEFMIYENENAKKAYTSFINEFSILWKNHEFINVFESNWMRISLKNNWQFKIIEKFKIYSLETKDKKILNNTFDNFHKKNRLKWTNQTILFSYSIFIAWRIVNDVRKKRIIVNIRELNDIIISDVYSISSQSEIINDFKNCTHIFVFDANFFFYQWKMHSSDIYKLTVMTHRKQKIFLISIMSCRNSVVYVQRQMNVLLRRLQEFVKIYIDEIVVKFKSLHERIYHLRQLFNLFVNKNINLNSIKIFLDYFEITLLNQRINAFDLSTTKNRFKILISLTMSKTFAKLETYFELIDYIKQYIHFYALISRFFQNLKTSLLKNEFRNDAKKKRILQKWNYFLHLKKKNLFKFYKKHSTTRLF